MRHARRFEVARVGLAEAGARANLKLDHLGCRGACGWSRMIRKRMESQDPSEADPSLRSTAIPAIPPTSRRSTHDQQKWTRRRRHKSDAGVRNCPDELALCSLSHAIMPSLPCFALGLDRSGQAQGRTRLEELALSHLPLTRQGFK